MKKLLFYLLFLLTNILAHANEKGRLNITPQDNLPLDKALDYVVSQHNFDGSFSFKEVRNYTDDLGIRHVSYQQYYNGVAVENGMVMFHAKKGNVYYINGTLMTQEETPNVSINSTRSVDAGPTVLLKYSNEYVECYKRNDFKNHKIVFISKESGDTIKSLSTEYNITGKGLTVYSGMQNMEVAESNGRYVLQDEKRKIVTCNTTNVVNYNLAHISDYYKLSEGYFSPTSTFYGMITGVQISKVSGSWWGNSIIDSEPDLYIVIKDSKGRELYRSNVVDDKMTATWNFGNRFVHIDEGSTIEIYDEDVDSDDYGGAINISITEPGLYTWSGEKTSGAIRIKANPAIDAHWGMQKVLDFYKEKLNRNGFNNLGTITYLFVDPYALNGTHELNNAYASYDVDGVGYMCFGLGDGIFMKPVVALDVMAHEFTHNVITFNGNGGLKYENESGALNESFADIMGTAIDYYAKGDKANWTIGEDVTVMHDQLRSMSNPKIGCSFNKNKLVDYLGYESYEDIPDETLTMYKDQMISFGFQPDTYKGEYWIPSTDEPDSDKNDNGGVHRNSGVQNYWFYLLSEGGNGVNDNGDAYEVTGIGIESAYKIAYRNLTTYLLPNATFNDAMEGSLKATIDLFGKDTKEYEAVQKAWYAVGVAAKDDNAVEQTSAVNKNYKIYSSNGQIIIEGAIESNISVYNINGSRICSFINKSEQATINTNGASIVIVKIDRQSFKVIIEQ